MPEIGRDQSAEPNQCGSCQHFRHRQKEYDTMGRCSVSLPPWVVSRLFKTAMESFEVDPRTVRDTDTCDLYKVRSEGGLPVEFTQQRVWRAGNPS